MEKCAMTSTLEGVLTARILIGLNRAGALEDHFAACKYPKSRIF
jgi:hypothetical protein